MPELSAGQPEDARVLAAVRGIGHPAAAAIIRFLAHHDEAQIGQIITGTGLVRPTVNRHLRDLRELGVIEAEVAIGAAPKYTLDRGRVEQITRAHLDYMLGEQAWPDGDALGPRGADRKPRSGRVPPS